MERKHNNTLTFCAMMTALSVVVLLLGSLLGTPNYPLFSCGRIVFPLINRVS